MTDIYAGLPVPDSGEHLEPIARTAPADRWPPGLPMLPRDSGWRRTAAYPPSCADGLMVTVLVTRMPAVFYRICAGPDSLGRFIDLATGSGAHDLVHAIATAIAAGMLGPAEAQAPDA